MPQLAVISSSGEQRRESEGLRTSEVGNRHQQHAESLAGLLSSLMPLNHASAADTFLLSRACGQDQHVVPPQKNWGYRRAVCLVEVEADEMEYLTQSRNPRGSILIQTYYSVYYIYIDTAALKSHPRSTT